MNLRKRQRGASAEVHTSAMNDIMFFLLLFFLIASTVTNPNVVKLMLPKSSSGQAVSKKTINVSIDQNLNYQVNKKPVPLDQLRGALEGYKSMANELTIVLFVEHTVAIENVVQVMDIAKDLNIKMVLATQPKGK
ncbi:biopolymer transporter ExbD [Mucilaginibacter terrenus]|uniref:Biopolymer transporter ExbD n=1 Tax=Mucilaginibacter terrenus TaxID=2482727 RepID=A0A3E2NMB9_9SPHI|nr:biopolymer transporter ExbD [Mucilaginibacter terrenus]RFZ82139.1 biopolymer transporter ExbD [Mucilaginibacter terrenus]